MTRHVIRSLGVMFVVPLLGRDALHPPGEVPQDGRVRIFLDDERSARVPQKDRAKSGRDIRLGDHPCHLGRDIVQTAPAGLYGQQALMDFHTLRVAHRVRGSDAEIARTEARLPVSRGRPRIKGVPKWLRTRAFSSYRTFILVTI